MSAYVINFSEPLRGDFTIPAGGMNGPGGSAADSTLRLYGRGALEWGEAVDEDLLRLAENFASASPPSEAIAGQIWVETALYYRDTNAGWYQWDFTTSTWGTTSLPVVTTIPTNLVQDKTLYFGPAPIAGAEQTTGLWGYFKLGAYEPAAWVSRAYISGTGAPSASLRPTQQLRFRDPNAINAAGTRGAWVIPSTTITSNTTPNGTVGMLWYQPSTGLLHVYSASGTWQTLLGPSNGTSMPQAYAPVNMSNYRIRNLQDPEQAQDAATMGWVQGQLVSGLNNKVNRSGDTMTGNLVVNAHVQANTLAVTGSGSVSGGFGVGGETTHYAVVNMTNQRIYNLGTPVLPTDAVHKQYVDAMVANVDVSNKYDKTGGPISGNVQITGALNMGGAITLPGAPTQPLHATTKQYVDSVASSGSPVGTIVAYAGPSGTPTGWLDCDGTAYPTSGATAALFSVINYYFGGSGGAFNVPDLRGMFVRGLDTTGAIDPGRTFGTRQNSQIERHKHLSVGEGQPDSPWGKTPQGGFRGIRQSDTDNFYWYTNNGGDEYGSVAGSALWNRVGLIGSETRPVNVALRYIIKY